MNGFYHWVDDDGYEEAVAAWKLYYDLYEAHDRIQPHYPSRYDHGVIPTRRTPATHVIRVALADARRRPDAKDEGMRLHDADLLPCECEGCVRSKM